jgi:integrase
VSDQRYTLAEWEAIVHGPLRDTSYREITGIGPLIVEWLAYKELQDRSERTIDQYERCLARLALRYPHKAASEITATDVNAFLAKIPPASRRKVRAALAGFFQWCVIFEEETGVARNPMLRVPQFAKPARDIYELFDEAERNDLESLPDINDSALMILLFGSAIRDGEARAAQVKHLREDDTRHVLKVEGKGRKKRLIPLRPRVVGAVQQLVLEEGLDPDDYLWWTQRKGQARSRSRPISYASFMRWWCRCLVAAGIVEEPNVPRRPDWLAWEKAVRASRGYRNPHITRHTYATEYLRRGGAIEKLSRILGHSSVEITDQAYGHLVTEDLAADAERVWG